MSSLPLDKEDKPRNQTSSASISSADEIRKLHELLKDGIITEEEFEDQKKKLLSRTD